MKRSHASRSRIPLPARPHAHALGTACGLDEDNHHQLAEDLPDLEQTTARLLRNPADLAAVFRPLYGDEVADRLKDLVTGHLVPAADLAKATKAGDTARAAEIER